MIKVGIFMADGCEEIEGLTVVDIVRRAKLEKKKKKSKGEIPLLLAI